MSFIKDGNFYTLELDDTIDEEDYVIPSFYKGLKVKKLVIKNHTSYDFDSLKLGENIEILEIKNCFKSYMKWIKHIRIDNLIINKKLKYIKSDGICLINNFDTNGNENFELLNGYVFQKYDSSIIFRLLSCKKPIDDDKRIKKLCFNVFEYDRVDLFIPSSVEEIDDRTLYNMYPVNISVSEDNKNFKIINNCLIEVKNNSLRKVINNDVDLSNMNFSRTDGYFFLMDSKEIFIPESCKVINNLHLPEFLRFEVKSHIKLLHDVEIRGDFELNCSNIELKFNNSSTALLIINDIEH